MSRSGTKTGILRSKAVPRFHFHLRDDMDVPDDEGRELPDLDFARARARELACFEVSEMVKQQGRVVLNHRIDIEDEQGTVLETVWFRDVVKMEGDSSADLLQRRSRRAGHAHRDGLKARGDR